MVNNYQSLLYKIFDTTKELTLVVPHMKKPLVLLTHLPPNLPDKLMSIQVQPQIIKY